MDYEKKYEKLVDAVKVLRDNNPSDEGIQNWVNDNVPELKESWEERIRKELIAYFEQFDNEELHGVDISDWIAWLEKQGEQKPADKVEPKFNVGDLVVTPENKVLQITSIEGTSYRFNNESHYWEICYCDEKCRLWTIRDAKDGDVLATSAGAFIYNSNNGGGSCPGSYCGIDTLGGFKTGVEHHWTGKYVFPATKEQRDLLFQKMNEAGYEWNPQKKELKEINSFCRENCKGFQETGKCFADGDCEAKIDAKKKELKKIHVIDEGKSEMDYCFTKMMNGEKVSSAWSEDYIKKNIRIIERLIQAISEDIPLSEGEAFDCLSWLKSLKQRIVG